MFKAKKHSREQLFEKAVLNRKERAVRRRVVPGEAEPLPWVSVSLWTSFVLVGGYILFFSPALLIQRVSVEGESVIPHEEYEDFTATNLEGAYLGVFKRRNYFLLPTDEIAGRILERYPLLSGVTVKRRFPDTVVLSLRESPVILRWCSAGPCYGVRDGRAALIPFSEDERYATSRLSVVDESALPVREGDLLPVESYLETFRIVRDGLARLAVSDVSEIAATPSRHSNELTLTVAEGWRLLVAIDRPAEETLGTLRVFLDEYAKEHKDRSNLDSVDLRVEGKVFYAEAGQPSEEAKPIETNPRNSSEERELKKKKKSD